MSTHKTKDGVHVFECDTPGCHGNAEGEQGDDFRTAWRAAQERGWVNATRVNKAGITEWDHYCPRCARDL
jgi:hypothetical protein